MENDGILSISEAVRRQYEVFPYPNYNLFLPLRWQDAYASHSVFAQRLAQECGYNPPNSTRGPILLAGCGDIFPSIAARWEPRSKNLQACDLSYSNLRRARLKTLTSCRKVDFFQHNLESNAPLLNESYSHIDSYGVLHHLANPSDSLLRLGQSLAPGGTLRMMVYNSPARTWIHHIQRAFALMGLTAFDSVDRRDALSILSCLEHGCPALTSRLAPMLGSFRRNHTRLVDTFFHAREARIDIGDWLNFLEQAGLRVIGMLDRYAELDDLPNPLLMFPGRDDLQVRANDRRFENNWELYAIKEPYFERGTPSNIRPAPLRPHFRSPPKSWFQYQETRTISPWMRQVLWQSFLLGLRGRSIKMDKCLNSLPIEAAQRLARIGALWPSQFTSTSIQLKLNEAIHPIMEIPKLPETSNYEQIPGLAMLLQKVLIRKQRDLSLEKLIADRFKAAQST